MNQIAGAKIPSVVRRVLAVTIGGLGDAVLFSPVIKALRYKYPRETIDLLVASSIAEELYSQSEYLNKIFLVRTLKKRAILNVIGLLPFCIESIKVGGYDLAVLATGLNPGLRYVLQYLANVHASVFAPLPGVMGTDIECNLQLASMFKQDASMAEVFVPLSKESLDEALGILKEHGLGGADSPLADYIVIYPSRDLPRRVRWPLSKLIEVAEDLKEKHRGIKVVIVGSEAEGLEWAREDTKRIADANLAGILTIPGVAALISRARLVVGNDGGLMHIAGATGVPVVAIFLNTPKSYRPPGKHVRLVTPALDCCSPRGYVPHLAADCIDKCIAVSQVVNACADLLNESVEHK